MTESLLDKTDRILSSVTAKHTPTPYKLEAHDEVANAIQVRNAEDETIVELRGGRYGYHANKDGRYLVNAEFIVRACNEYEQDKETIRDLVAALEVAIGYVALVASGTTNMPIKKERAQSDSDILSAALAKARGQA